MAGRATVGHQKMEKAATLVMLQPPTPARELPARSHVPSQPLKRSPLSQFQTSADISQRRRFFQVWWFRESPRLPTDQSSSGGQRLWKPALFDRRLWTCHFGYALATNSCERVAGVDACTAAVLDAITAFAVSKPRQRSRNPVDFFGSGGFASHLAYRSLRLTSSRLPIGCRSFLPSTKAILTEGEQMSTPKVCAQPAFLLVRNGW